jgi:putative tryptophan/tyrosine transport system substrate-binding protein
MRRRDFIALVGGAAVWPAVSFAQTNSIRRLAVFMPCAETDLEIRPRVAALRAGLRELGWIEGTNIELVFRWAAGSPDRIRAYAAELVAMQPDLILASTTPTVTALVRGNRDIPTVFVMVVDPVGQGLVRSLSKPGGNFTGFTHFEFGMAGKWLELIKDAAPLVAKTAVIFNPDTAPYYSSFMDVLSESGNSSAIESIVAPSRDPAELVRHITAFAQGANGGLIVLPDTFTTINRELIVSLAARHHLPAIYPLSQFTAGGGLISYGPDLVDLYRRAPIYIDRILKGGKPADLPIQQPTKFELIVNLKTAKALGLEVPPTLLARADEVIE